MKKLKLSKYTLMIHEALKEHTLKEGHHAIVGICHNPHCVKVNIFWFEKYVSTGGNSRMKIFHKECFQAADGEVIENGT